MPCGFFMIWKARISIRVIALNFFAITVAVGAFAKCDNAFDDISKPICFTNNRIHLIVLRQY